MKLEIKHLAPYLPYGLKVWSEEKLPFSPFFENKIEKHSYEMGVVSMMAILQNGDKPILRPLSELTKEMEIYDKKITFIDWVKQTWGYNVFEYQGYFKYAHWFKLEGEEPAILHLPYCIIETLFYLHFDVFGLIEKGLAIDINDLKH